MNSLLKALQEGRLVELPDDRKKEHALTLLSNLLEAIPSVPADTDIAGSVLARETTGNTALGKGWACPHARLGSDGELLCAVGWSPSGIEYGANNTRLVHILVMYLIPPNQKNAYLHEVSSIARALQKQPDDLWENLPDLTHVRNQLLNMMDSELDSAAPEARARMIQLETRQAATRSLQASTSFGGLDIQVLTIIAGPSFKPVVLTHHLELIALVESIPDLSEKLTLNGVAEAGNWRILSRSATNYLEERVVFDCLALHHA